MVRRRQVCLSALAGAAMLAAPPLLRAQPRPERSRVVIAVGGKAALHQLPLTIAEQLGYFRDEGLEVEMTDLGSHARGVQAVSAGTADLLSGAFEYVIGLHARGQPYVAFVQQARAPAVALGVSTRAMPAYNGVGDLRGRRIGVTAPGSTSNLVAHLVLARAGIGAADASLIGVGSAAGAVAALRAGQIDAISNVDPVMTQLELKGEVRIIADTRTMRGSQEVFGGPMPAACLHAPAEFVQKNPATVQALANAVVHALKWLQTAGPSDIHKTVPEAHLLGDRALYLASFNRVRDSIATDGMMPAQGPRTALAAVASLEPGLRAERIDLGRTFSNDFARRAKERYRA